MSVWSTLGDWIQSSEAETTLLVFLVAGHMLGDFVLQSGRMVEEKRHSLPALFRHGGVVALAHAVLLTPFIVDGKMLAVYSTAVVVVGLSHLLIDRWKILAEARDLARGRGRRIRWWVVDQLAHLVSAVATWRLALALAGDNGVAFAVPEPLQQVLLPIGATIAIVSFNVHGGSALIAAMIDACNPNRQAGSGSSGKTRAAAIHG